MEEKSLKELGIEPMDCPNGLLAQYRACSMVQCSTVHSGEVPGLPQRPAGPAAFSKAGGLGAEGARDDEGAIVQLLAALQVSMGVLSSELLSTKMVMEDCHSSCVLCK